jgi:hypothetical protein
MLYRHPSPAAGTALGVPKQVPTSSRFAMIPPTNCLARQESDKNAPPRVRRYRSLNAVLEAGFFRSEAKILRPYRLIATMDALAPLPSLVDQASAWASTSNLACTWGLNQLAGRLEEKV